MALRRRLGRSTVRPDDNPPTVPCLARRLRVSTRAAVPSEVRTVARRTKHPVVYLALSPAAVATAIGVDPRVVSAAIADGELKVFQRGKARRILCAHVEQWILSWPEAAPYKRKVTIPCP